MVHPTSKLSPGEGDKNASYRISWVYFAAWISALAGIASLALGFFEIYRQARPIEPAPTHFWTARKFLEAVVLTAWVVFPPVWFWLEYFFIFKEKRLDQREGLELFKYGQDVASKIWLALVTSLLLLYFGKDLRLGG